MHFTQAKRWRSHNNTSVPPPREMQWSWCAWRPGMSFDVNDTKFIFNVAIPFQVNNWPSRPVCIISFLYKVCAKISDYCIEQFSCNLCADDIMFSDVLLLFFIDRTKVQKWWLPYSKLFKQANRKNFWMSFDLAAPLELHKESSQLLLWWYYFSCEMETTFCWLTCNNRWTKLSCQLYGYCICGVKYFNNFKWIIKHDVQYSE